ncbi:MAG TPA: PepSY domain-containing protein [bacterium]|nr:PepSY domain-containing protein [bacterium]
MTRWYRLPFIASLAGGTLALLAFGAIAADYYMEKASPEQVKAAGQATIPMADAITTAVAEVGGEAIEAVLSTDYDTLVFEVEVLKGDDLIEVLVDAKSGAIVMDSDDEEDDEGMDDEEDEDPMEGMDVEGAMDGMDDDPDGKSDDED